jgi:Nidogen-like
MSVGSQAALRLLFAAVCWVLVISAPAAAAGPNAIENLPACTAKTFVTQWDDDSRSVPLGFTADFSGTPKSTINVNVNGSVTLDDMLIEYAPLDFTTTSDVIIAPFEADVDTTAGGSPITYGAGTDGTTHYFCVNWVGVGYSGGHGTKFNSFQLVLRQTAGQAADGAFTITFNYDAITWDTGAGGVPAAVGFSAGDGAPGRDYIQPGSFTEGALLDSNAATGLIHNSHDGGGQRGRYVFSVAGGGGAGGRLHGTVYRSDYSTPVAFAPVQICRVGGACVTRSTNYAGNYVAAGLAPGSYDVTAFPRDEEGTAGTLHGLAVTGGDDLAPQIILGAAPWAPPDGTSVTGLGVSPRGIPVVSASHGGTITTLACRGAAVQYAIGGAGKTLAQGPMHQLPGAGDPATYQASYPVMSSFRGDADVTITGTCPGSADPVNYPFDLYVVPSGKVIDTNGRPLAGATVTLQRAESPSGAFIQVPEGSPELGAGNRRNPALTAGTGAFGWDVVAGYYRILATRPGCVSASNHASRTASAVVQVPSAGGPTLRLFCGEAPGGTKPVAGGPHGPERTATSVERAVAASLSSQLKALLRRLATRLSVPGVRSFKISFSAAAPGRMSLRVTRRGGRRAITIARGSRTVTAAGPTRIRVKLTSRGRSLLRAALRADRRTRLKVSLTFAPRFDGQPLSPVQTTGRFSVRR